MTLILRIKGRHTTYMAADSQVNNSLNQPMRSDCSNRILSQSKLYKNVLGLTVGMSGSISCPLKENSRTEDLFNFNNYIRDILINHPKLDGSTLIVLLKEESKLIKENVMPPFKTTLMISCPINGNSSFILSDNEFAIQKIQNFKEVFDSRVAKRFCEKHNLSIEIISSFIKTDLFQKTFDINFDYAINKYSRPSLLYSIIGCLFIRNGFDSIDIDNISELDLHSIVSQVYSELHDKDILRNPKITTTIGDLDKIYKIAK